MPDANDSGWASTVVVGSITGIALTAEWLPREVAAHFSLDGHVDGFVAHNSYVAFAIGATVAVAALAATLLRIVVLGFPDLVHLPNRSYWLAPEQRASTAKFLGSRALWLAALLSSFTLGLHLLVLQANHTSPARLEPVPLAALTIAFLAALGAWFKHLYRHFERTESTAQ